MNSYATSFPNDGDLYIEAVFTVNSDSVFADVVEGTAGALIRKDQYRYLEMFAIPEQEEPNVS